jgi:hypothetical protein
MFSRDAADVRKETAAAAVRTVVFDGGRGENPAGYFFTSPSASRAFAKDSVWLPAS